MGGLPKRARAPPTVVAQTWSSERPWILACISKICYWHRAAKLSRLLHRATGKPLHRGLRRHKTRPPSRHSRRASLHCRARARHKQVGQVSRLAIGRRGAHRVKPHKLPSPSRVPRWRPVRQFATQSTQASGSRAETSGGGGDGQVIVLVETQER